MRSSLLVQFEHSAMQCEQVVTYHKRNDFPAHINPLIGSACQNALCSADDATKAEMAAVWRYEYICANTNQVTWQNNAILIRQGNVDIKARQFPTSNVNIGI